MVAIGDVVRMMNALFPDCTYIGEYVPEEIVAQKATLLKTFVKSHELLLRITGFKVKEKVFHWWQFFTKNLRSLAVNVRLKFFLQFYLPLQSQQFFLKVGILW